MWKTIGSALLQANVLRKAYSTSSQNEGKGKGRVRKILIRSVLALGLIAGGAKTYELVEDYRTEPPPWHKKERVVILGSGWAALSAVRELDPRYYEIAVVSPRNYFLFTPLLPSTTTGTVELRSIIEPIRMFLNRMRCRDAQFFEAEAVDVDVSTKEVRCVAPEVANQPRDEFKVPYDVLVVACGAVNNTFNVPGVRENCMFLKELPDARKIRTAVVELFERANTPGRSEDEIRRLLHFVVVGGGPTGVEFAAELRDLIRQDVNRLFPKLAPMADITLVESLDHILNSFSRAIADFCTHKFERNDIDIKTNARVTGVTDKAVMITTTAPGSKPQDMAIPYGLCVWSTGIGPSALTQALIGRIPGQSNRRALTTDVCLQVKGAPDVWAAGDCATVEQRKLMNDCNKFFADADTNGDGILSEDEFKDFVKILYRKYPDFKEYGAEVWKKYQKLQSAGPVTQDQFSEIVKLVESKFKSYPATAQVAAQQGLYLGRQLNERAMALVKGNVWKASPFQYQHFGSFTYIGGDEAVAEFPTGWSTAGFGTWVLWRSVYLSKLVSTRNKVSVAFDWSKAIVFGRDISRY